MGTTFKPGQYVKTTDGLTGFVFGDNSDNEARPYEIAICEHDEERSVSASELTLWVPKADDKNADANCDDGEVGEFLHPYGEDASVVKWKSFPLPEIRLNSGIEPVWKD